jgi:hypothetical protein
MADPWPAKEFWVRLRARPSAVPPYVRLRRYVKHGQWYELQCVDYFEVLPDGPQRPPPAGHVVEDADE